jgi:glycine hydroxymethyltransferase
MSSTSSIRPWVPAELEQAIRSRAAHYRELSSDGLEAGMILTNEAELARRLDAIAYPGLTANFDLGKTAALIVAMLDLREYGRAYGQMCIANAQALAAALAQADLPVHHVAGRGYTASQHIAIHARKYGGGGRAARLLEQANILTSGIELPLPQVAGDFNALRLGTQEITRWGMAPADMAQIAELIARVLVRDETPARVRTDVVALRRRFQQLHFVRCA